MPIIDDIKINYETNISEISSIEKIIPLIFSEVDNMEKNLKNSIQKIKENSNYIYNISIEENERISELPLINTQKNKFLINNMNENKS
jgi:hypothetical protein